jgi:hypothetical protein
MWMKTIFLQIQKAVKNARKKNRIGLHYGCALYVDMLAGCCDSSIGLHARKHYENTHHPVMIALPNKPWRWSYEHEQYY